MDLPQDLLMEFARLTNDQDSKPQTPKTYGTAVEQQDGTMLVVLDGSDITTPATFAVNASNGDRVMVEVKDHKVIVTANITNPSMTLGELKVNNGLVVKGYLTTNENRVAYNDRSNTGVTFSSGGIGGYGGSGKYFELKTTGELVATSADISGAITATSGYLGTTANGFKIDSTGIYSGPLGDNTRSLNESGYISLSTADFSRVINGISRTGLRFAIGSKFGVAASGVIYASDVDLTGKITATTGAIGDFTILNGDIYSNGKIAIDHNSNGVFIGSAGIALGTPSTGFKVTSTGALTANTATISGTITAGAGSTIGPWTVSSSAIYNPTTAVFGTSGLYFGTSGLSIVDKFKVDNTGALTASRGTIGGWVIDSTVLSKNSDNTTTTDDFQYRAYMSAPDHPAPGNNVFAVRRRRYNGSGYDDWENMFVVSYGGVLVAKSADIEGKITATSGSIGNFTISSGKLYSNNHSAYNSNVNGIYIGDDYISFGPGGKFYVTSAGVPYCNGQALYINSNVNMGGSFLILQYEGTRVGTLGYSPSSLETFLTGSYCGIRADNDIIVAAGDNLILHAVNNIILGVDSGPSPVILVNGYIRSVLSICVGETVKTGGLDGKPGVSVNAQGNLYLTHGSGDGSSIFFCFNNSTSVTSRIYESSSGTLTMGNALVVNKNMGVGTTSDAEYRRIEVRNNAASVQLRASADGKHGIYSSTKSDWIVWANATGTFNPQLSDRRAKTDLGEMSEHEALSILKGVSIKNFSYKSDSNGVIQNGVIAQDLRDVLMNEKIGYRPYLIVASNSNDSDDIYYELSVPEEEVRYSVDYGKIVPVIWRGWQIHHSEINKLKETVKRLEERIKVLEGAA